MFPPYTGRDQPDGHRESDTREEMSFDHPRSHLSTPDIGVPILPLSPPKTRHKCGYNNDINKNAAENSKRKRKETKRGKNGRDNDFVHSLPRSNVVRVALVANPSPIALAPSSPMLFAA